jgi:hypothetical protein
MYPVRDTTHAAEAAKLTIDQYKQSVVVAGLIGVLANEVQILEDSIWTVLDNMTLAAQPLVGGPFDILDKIGALVGQPRNGLSDALYLAAIKLKARVNRSDGLAEDLIQITAILFSGFTYREWYPASWEIDLGATSTDVTSLIALLAEAKAAATAGDLRFYISGPIWVWDSTTGHLGTATGLKDSVGGTFPNAPVSLQLIA